MINEDTKIQDIENEPISRLLGGLKRVEAPKDFDFRVKARIANGRPVEKTTSWLPASVRYAVPLVLLVLIGGYFGLSSFYSTDGVNVPVVAGVPARDAAPVVAPPPNDDVVMPTNDIVAERIDAQPPASVNKIAPKQPEKTVSTRKSKVERPGGGSYDTASTVPVTLSPTGIEQNSNLPQVPQTPVKKVQLSAKDFLTSIGITASFPGSGGRIQSVGGAAAIAGVKAGDVIESVNVQSGSIRVRRDGKSILIGLK